MGSCRRGPTTRRRRGGGPSVVVFAVVFFARPCDARDFFDPAQRERRNTAYALPKGMAAAEIGILGTSTDLYGRLGGAYGFGGGVEAGINLLHAGVGILNLQTKWTFLDRKKVGLAFRLGLLWGHGNWMWILSEDQRQVVRGLDLIAIPADLIASFPVVSWLQLDLQAGYQHGEVFGGSGGDTVIDARIGIRQVALGASVRSYLADRVQLFFTANLPVWTAVPRDVGATVRAAEGVYLGLRSTEYETIPFRKLYTLNFGVNSAMGRRSYITFSMIYRRSDEDIYGFDLHPSLKLEFRFR